MNEELFADKLRASLKKIGGLGNYVVSAKKPIYYYLHIDSDGKVTDRANVKGHIKRGRGAFETDILIHEKRSDNITIPLVVVELKTKVRTHDVIVYGVKAERHRSIYPWLRYGMLFGDKNIPPRFMLHGKAIDFAYAFDGEQPSKKEWSEIAAMIRTQVWVAHTIRDLIDNKMPAKCFSNGITVK